MITSQKFTSNLGNSYSGRRAIDVAQETIKTLSEIYGIECSTFAWFCDGAQHEKNNISGKHMIKFGVGYLKENYDLGFVDYRADWIITRKFGKHPKGEDAVKCIAAHEYAHVLQTENGYRVRGKMHGAEWEHYYLEIIDLIF